MAGGAAARSVTTSPSATRGHTPVAPSLAGPRVLVEGLSTFSARVFTRAPRVLYGPWMTRNSRADPARLLEALEATPYEMYSHMVDVVSVKVTASGQISLPAHLRRRWQADEVLVIDKGDYALVRPVPTDVVAELRGSLAPTVTTADEVREQERALEAQLEQERWSSSTPPR